MELIKLTISGYLLLISFIAVIVMAIDKFAAIYHKRRIPEKMFFVISLLGGSAAVYLSMTLFNHKTQKNSFVFIIPLIFALQVTIIYLVYKYV